MKLLTPRVCKHSLHLMLIFFCIGTAHAENEGLPLRGFADVGAAQSIGSDPNRQRGFNVGNIDFYLTPKFENVRGLIELVFEVDGEGGLATDLERVQIGAPTGDRSVLWFGRWHTPFGRWHTGFHHGAQIQTSINRPRFLDFEDKGGMLPSHSLGLWWTGNHPRGEDHINYSAYIANGNQIATSADEKLLSFNAAGDNNNGKLIGASLAYQWVSSLEIGLHAYRDTVETYLNGDTSELVNRNAVMMAGSFLSYDANDWEIMVEWYHFANDTQKLAAGAPGREGDHDSDLWFAQAGRLFQKWMPYLRIEQARLDANDAYFNSMDSGQPYKREAAGLRYNWNTRTAFKLELTRTHDEPIDQLDTSAGVGTVAAGDKVSYTRLQWQASINF